MMVVDNILYSGLPFLPLGEASVRGVLSGVTISTFMQNAKRVLEIGMCVGHGSPARVEALPVVAYACRWTSTRFLKHGWRRDVSVACC